MWWCNSKGRVIVRREGLNSRAGARYRARDSAASAQAHELSGLRASDSRFLPILRFKICDFGIGLAEGARAFVARVLGHTTGSVSRVCAGPCVGFRRRCTVPRCRFSSSGFYRHLSEGAGDSACMPFRDAVGFGPRGLGHIDVKLVVEFARDRPLRWGRDFDTRTLRVR